MSDREVFTLTLYTVSSQDYLVENVAIGNITYMINWDELFSGRNKSYKNCYVRMNLYGATKIIKGPTVQQALGWVSITGLGNTRTVGNDLQGLVMSALDVEPSIQDATSLGTYLRIDTTKSLCPPQITPPEGIGYMSVLLLGMDGSIKTTNITGYDLTLYFELFDPKYVE